MKKDFYPYTAKNIIIERDNKVVVENFIIPPNELEEINKGLGKRWEKNMFGVISNNFYCGYVIFNKSQLPREFAYSYDEIGFNSLRIHGGLSYHAIISEDKEKRDALNKLYYEKLKNKNADTDKEDIENWYIDEKVKLGYEYVVFGFDCNHYGDKENKSLRDKEFIFKLVEQMESQILALADIWEDFKSQPSDDLKRILLKPIIKSAEFDTNEGLGQMIKKLRGKL